jgi:hypothetical protein
MCFHVLLRRGGRSVDNDADISSFCCERSTVFSAKQFRFSNLPMATIMHFIAARWL